MKQSTLLCYSAVRNAPEVRMPTKLANIWVQIDGEFLSFWQKKFQTIPEAKMQKSLKNKIVSAKDPTKAIASKRDAEGKPHQIWPIAEPHPNGSILPSSPNVYAAIAGIVGIVYAIGFLVEFTFLSSYGIREMGAEAFKAKYIYVGLLCLQFPVSAIIVVLGFIQISQTVKKQKEHAALEQLKAYRPSLYLLLNLLFVFYLLTAFSRPGLFHEHEISIGLLFVLMIVGLILAKGIEDKINYQRKNDKWIGRLLNELKIEDESCQQVWAFLRWLVLLISWGLTVYVFCGHSNVDNTWMHLFDMALDGGWLHFGFIFLAALMLWRIQRRKQAYSALGMRNTLLAMMLAITFALSYLAVVFFAYRVYPYIPANRGGGDYSTVKPSVLIFDQKSIDAIPEEILDRTGKSVQSKPVMVLHESGSTVYVTLDVDALRWRKSGMLNKPKKIFTFKKDIVISEIFEN